MVNFNHDFQPDPDEMPVAGMKRVPLGFPDCSRVAGFLACAVRVASMPVAIKRFKSETGFDLDLVAGVPLTESEPSQTGKQREIIQKLHGTAAHCRIFIFPGRFRHGLRRCSAGFQCLATNTGIGMLPLGGK